jgi:hypothetical protein
MNVLIPIALIALVLVFVGLKWNNFRTKFAFFFILAGVLFILFLAFMFMSGESFDFSSVAKVFASIKVYFLWIKGVVVNIFEITGKAIGVDVNPTNSTIFGR